MLRRVCKEHKLRINYKGTLRLGQDTLLLQPGDRKNEHIANGWEMFVGSFR
jgi:hypothetical protein